MKERFLSRRSIESARYGAGLILCAFLVVCFISGCGLETDKANKILESALAHQEKAEVVMRELAVFPHAWERTFDVSWVGPEQLETARTLLNTNKGHLNNLIQELNSWKADLEEIESINVGDKIKKYVGLKLKAIKCGLEYAQGTLASLLDKYAVLVEMLAQGKPLEEKNVVAEEISLIIAESAEKREECTKLHEEADRYFVKEKLGETKESRRGKS